MTSSRESHSPAEVSIGIDTVRLTTPIDPGIWQSLVAPNVTTPWVQVGLPATSSRVEIRHGYATIQASLPKVKHGTNVTCVDPVEVEDICRSLVSDCLNTIALTQQGAEVSFDHFWFTRVDVVRDFDGVQPIGPLLDGLEKVLGRRRGRRSRYSRSQSLGFHRDNWKARLYDKHQESKGEAPPGSLRFETQLYKERLRSTWAVERGGPWVSPSDVDADSARLLARDTFDYLGFSLAVHGAESRLERVRRLIDTPRDRAVLLAMADHPSIIGDFTWATRNRYRPWLDEIGTDADDMDRTLRLDFESGALVTYAG